MLPLTERRIEAAGVSTAVLEGGAGPPRSPARRDRVRWRRLGAGAVTPAERPGSSYDLPGLGSRSP